MIKHWLLSKVQGCRAMSSYWIAQRITAAIMGAYLLVVMIFLKSNSTIDFYTWRYFFTSTTMSIFSTLFLLSVCWHSWLGLWLMITRYLKTSLIIRKGVLSIMTLMNILYSVWGIAIIWGI